MTGAGRYRTPPGSCGRPAGEVCLTCGTGCLGGEGPTYRCTCQAHAGREQTPMERDFPAICDWVRHQTVRTDDLRRDLLRALTFVDPTYGRPPCTEAGCDEPMVEDDWYCERHMSDDASTPVDSWTGQPCLHDGGDLGRYEVDVCHGCGTVVTDDASGSQ